MEQNHLGFIARFHPVASKEVTSNKLRTWNEVPVQLARNSPPRVMQVVSTPTHVSYGHSIEC